MSDDTAKPTGPSPYIAGTGGKTRSRQHAPSAQRNTAPILAVLEPLLPERGRALEIASGTGQHAVAFARAFPGIEWTPSDPDPSARASIAAWAADAGLENLGSPLDIDVMRGLWEEGADGPYDAVLAINLVHIAPWAATPALLRGSAELLTSGGLLYLYGAYKREGVHTAPSNQAFDAWLRAQDPSWGVRDVSDVGREAAACGFTLREAVAMPANNLSLVFRKEKV